MRASAAAISARRASRSAGNVVGQCERRVVQLRARDVIGISAAPDQRRDLMHGHVAHAPCARIEIFTRNGEQALRPARCEAVLSRPAFTRPARELQHAFPLAHRFLRDIASA